MLYTTKEIAGMYGVSSYKVTQNWCKKGLKHTPEFEFKKEWVDEFLEDIAIQELPKNYSTVIRVSKLKKHNFKKITLEDLEVK